LLLSKEEERKKREGKEKKMGWGIYTGEYQLPMGLAFPKRKDTNMPQKPTGMLISCPKRKCAWLNVMG